MAPFFAPLTATSIPATTIPGQLGWVAWRTTAAVTVGSGSAYGMYESAKYFEEEDYGMSMIAAFGSVSLILSPSYSMGKSLFVLRGTALTSQSLIIDSNVAIALEKQAAGLPLQAGEQAIINRLSSMGITDLRITHVGASEIANAKSFGRIVSNTGHPDHAVLLKALENAGVGRSKGIVDRQIIAEVFFAEGSQARFLSLDKGVYNPLAGLAGHNPAKLGKAVPLAFPNGFTVTINGRTILIIPVKQ